jgi:hypothetical protein
MFVESPNLMLEPYVYAFCFTGVLLLMACRGEKIPRDYQNAPPAMTHPVDKASEAPDTKPSAVDAEPSLGAEGTSPPHKTTTNVSAPVTRRPPQKGLPPNAVITPHATP